LRGRPHDSISLVAGRIEVTWVF